MYQTIFKTKTIFKAFWSNWEKNIRKPVWVLCNCNMRVSPASMLWEFWRSCSWVSILGFKTREPPDFANQSRTCHLLLHRVGTLCVNVTHISQWLVFSLRPDSQASGLIYATFKAQNGQPCCGLYVDLWWPICSYCLMADQGQSDESSSLVKLSGKFENTRAPGLGHRGFRIAPQS